MSAIRPARIVPAVIAVVAVCAMSACGNSTTSASSSDNAPSSPRTAGSSPTNRGMPGASGLIAAITDQTLQVQGNNNQVAVTWTPTTHLTKEVAASLSAVTMGSCVEVVSAPPTGADGTTPTDGSTPRGTSGGATTATTVLVTAPVNGSCQQGFGAGFARPGGAGGPGGPGGGTGGTGTRTARPTGSPSDGATRRPGGYGQFVIGSVTAVSGSGFTVQPAVGQRPATSGAPSPTATSTASPAPVDVTVAANTAYQSLTPASATDIAVGGCVQAVGTADATGAITATSLTLSAPVNGACQGGFGGGRGRANG